MSIKPATIDALHQVSTATLASQLFQRGFRNCFLVGLTARNPSASSFVGEAFTLRYIPAREDIDEVGVFRDPEYPQRKAVESIGPGQVLVMDCRGETRTGSIGSILATRVQARGAVAVVTDGSIRDSGDIAKMDFPIYSAGVSAGLSLSAHHAVDMQVPVGCAGVPIFPGDVLVGDHDGVICIPREIVDEVAMAALEQEKIETFVLERIKAGGTIFDNYPPTADTVEAFRRAHAAHPPA